MKKRPKLSVSSGSKVEKQQAPGFDTGAAVSGLDAKPDKLAEEKPAMSAKPDQITNTEHIANAEHVANAEQMMNEAGLQKPAWANGRQIVKAVLVIAATAASLYLIKRRFF